MVEVTKPNKEPKTYNLPLGQAYIKGRISHFRKQKFQERGLIFFTILRIPAADEYSFPGVVELSSSSPLGQAGTDWEGFVEITGMTNNFDTKPDPNTGEVQQIKSARNWLRVVE
jgi:hypothetical protein